MKLTNILCNSSNLHITTYRDVAKRTSVCLDEYAHKQIPLVSFPSSETFQSSFWYSTGFSITSKYTVVFTCAGFAWYFSIEEGATCFQNMQEIAWEIFRIKTPVLLAFYTCVIQLERERHATNFPNFFPFFFILSVPLEPTQMSTSSNFFYH